MRTEFYCRKAKASKKTGKASIQVAISINGERKFHNLPLQYDPTEFKKLTEAKRDNELKKYLDSYRRNIDTAVMEMSEYKIPLTHSNLQEWLKNGGIKSYTIDVLFTDFLKITKQRTDITETVKNKYELLQKEFYNHIDKNKEVNEITHSVILSFYTSLNNKYKQSTVAGKMTKLKTIISYGINEGKIKKNPFSQIKIRKPKGEITYLTEKDIDNIINKDFSCERLNNVRNLFLIQMATGLSYGDLTQLRSGDLRVEENGELNIIKDRLKTGEEFISVVFSFAKDLILSEMEKGGGKIRVLTNQKYNAYLKEIQSLTCPYLKFNLTTHLARRTYATRLINDGVRLETVAKCLGHSRTATTESFYAKLKTDTIIKEVREAIKAK